MDVTEGMTSLKAPYRDPAIWRYQSCVKHAVPAIVVFYLQTLTFISDHLDFHFNLSLIVSLARVLRHELLSRISVTISSSTLSLPSSTCISFLARYLFPLFHLSTLS